MTGQSCDVNTPAPTSCSFWYCSWCSSRPTRYRHSFSGNWGGPRQRRSPRFRRPATFRAGSDVRLDLDHRGVHPRPPWRVAILPSDCCDRRRFESAVNVAPVSDLHDRHDDLTFDDLADDSVAALPHAVHLATGELLATGRPRVRAQCLDPLHLTTRWRSAFGSPSISRTADGLMSSL